tara:strand:- start:703 stop:1125 length:423 start_codon:yes stop_codon:yes gene_type:complete
MKYSYTPITKNQLDNPFCKLTSQDHHTLERQLQDILHFICQLGASKTAKDREFYTIMTTLPDRAFGRAPQYSNAPNTGLAAISGACAKMRQGDLSRKQINNIELVLEAVNRFDKKKFSHITFEESSKLTIADSPFHSLFE